MSGQPWDYTDATGGVVYRKRRSKQQKGWFEHPDGTNGKPDGVPEALYCPSGPAGWAERADEPLHWEEGEPDADAVAAAKGLAITHGSAGSSTAEQAERVGRQHRGPVVVCADRDPAGYRCAARRQQQLLDAGVPAERVRVVRTHNRGHKDVRDHLEAGRLLEKLRRVPEDVLIAAQDQDRGAASSGTPGGESAGHMFALEDFDGLTVGRRPFEGEWWKTQCPSAEHDDTNPSASLRLITDDWGEWTCHTCRRHGSVLPKEVQDDFRNVRPELSTDDPSPVGWPMVTGAELAATSPPVLWLVRQVLEQDTFGPLAGPKKSLKTYTALALAVAVASGKPFLNHPEFTVPSARPVVYFSGEGGPDSTRRRLHRIAASMSIDPQAVGKLPLHMVFNSGPMDGRDFKATYRTANAMGPGLIVLDNLYNYHGTGVAAENQYERGPMLAELSNGKAPDTTLLVLDHFRKQTSTLDLDSIAYSGMGQWADSWLLLSHGEGSPDLATGSFRLNLEVGSRDADNFGSYVLRVGLGVADPDTGAYSSGITWEVGAGGDEPTKLARHTEAQQAVVAVLRAQPGTFTSKDQLIERAMSAGFARAVVRKALDELIIDGFVQHEEQPGDARRKTYQAASLRVQPVAGGGSDAA